MESMVLFTFILASNMHDMQHATVSDNMEE
jgi:hypothetical protein